MPLKKGASKDVVSHNISELVRSGRTPAEAVAIALHNADQTKNYADGGQVDDGSQGSGKPDKDDTKNKTLGSLIGYPGSDSGKSSDQKDKKAYADGGDVH